MTKYKVIMGSLWTEFDEIKGSIPVQWVPESLTEEILFSVALRCMSVFSCKPADASYSKMLATVPFPEYDLFSISTILFEDYEQNRGGYKINLISILIPAFLMESSWIDIRQIQGVFQQYFNDYNGEHLTNKAIILKNVALAVDNILKKKLEVIYAGEEVKEVVDSYLHSYHVNSLNADEKQLLVARLRTLLELLNRVLEAGDNERIHRAISRMNYVLEHELSEEPLVTMYSEALIQLIDF
ncbi:MAG: hypothetical protein ACTSPG_05575 [Candidatus Hodarchaeales archaeon]